MAGSGSDSVEELMRALAESEERYRKLLADAERQARERAEKEFQAEITRLSSELAHDLRGPLQTITNSIFLMERKPCDTTYIPKINEALKHATSLLDSFREYYRGSEITPMRGNVNRLLEKAVEDVTTPPGVSIIKNLAQNIPDESLDLAKIRRVFAIILKNAMEAMPNGGTITLTSYLEGDRVVVKVTDTGTGIPDAKRDKVFIAFESRKKGGFGLGLAASKRIVEAHCGTISFETEVDKGTTFTVTLPGAGPK